MIMNPQRTIDLRSVSYSEFFWRNQFGETVRCKPRHPTRHGQSIPDEYAFPFLVDYPCETVLERCHRIGVIDEWTPVCIYQFRNNHSLTFTGSKAIDKHKQFNKHITQLIVLDAIR